MAIPETFHDRRREGEDVLRQCQFVQLHLLYVFDAICRELGLKYFLSGGSALGAARHRGFIPWDDDLDVGMPMKDYKIFVQKARCFLPKDTILVTPKDIPFTANPFSKLRDTGSYYCECRPDIATSDPSGIYLDIFPYEEMPEIGRPLQVLLKTLISSSWYRMHYFYNNCRWGVLMSLICAPLGFLANALHLAARALTGALKFCFPCKTTFLMFETIYKHSYKTADIYPLKKLQFEDGEFPVPGNIDAYLAAQYGDWRQVPPPEKRPRHARIIDPFHAA